MEATLQVWYTKSVSYPATQYKIGNDGYDVSNHVAGFADMVGKFRARGVSCELLNKILDFGKSLPQKHYRNWDSLKVSCPMINYPKINITSPTNATSFNINYFTVNVNATVPSGSIGKVEFYDDKKLIGTDNIFPYSFDFKTMQAGAHLIIAKAYNQLGQASLDSRMVIVNDNNVTSNDSKEEEFVKSNIELHPNPATTELYVSGRLVVNANYEITSIEGKSLQMGVVNGGGISIENLKTGLYIIKIKSEAGDRVQRFVKE